MKILFIFFYFIISCANYKSLSGGDKDLSPPRFLYSTPQNLSTCVKINLKEIKIFFDENIKLYDIHNNIIINPYYIRKYVIFYPINFSKKYISIRLKKTLKKNTTYSIQFHNCIKDDKEGNILPFFKYVFSTGKNIDSIYIKGNVKKNIFELKNKKNLIIGLYHINNCNDIILNKKPDYIAHINYENNQYKITYIKKGKYLLLCFDDKNGNQIHESNKKELVFFKKTFFLLKDKEFDIQISK
ncbi:Ig-like domain-containing protein [Blattabacterium cuenoti]|uniref:Ig-like domain-containing protein n=1 Tax=Blattabacterium cuenoti TaxID=1653831 RepID=UPI00163C0C79|nr:Ig-like domain-containing protein [Blattabacterium cuenoti]